MATTYTVQNNQLPKMLYRTLTSEAGVVCSGEEVFSKNFSLYYVVDVKAIYSLREFKIVKWLP